MNNKLYKLQFAINECLATIIVSLFIVIVMCFCIELELMFRCEEKINLNELNVENLSKFATLEELEKKYQETPEDYILNIRLASLYESLGKNQKAHDFYKNALNASKRANYALYSYAMFCIRNDLYATSAALVEELNGNSKIVNAYKAEIYEKIAEHFDEIGDFDAALKGYQIVYKYANSIGDGKYVRKIKSKYAKEYIKLADYNIQKGNIEEAISNLKNSIRLKKSAIAEYKLGLIYQENDLYQAEKHVNTALAQNPYIVNPYIYNNILNKLIDEARILGDDSRYTYYSNRLSRFKKLINEIYLFKEDVLIENPAIITKKNIFNKNKYIVFVEIENNSKEELKNLFLKTEVYINGEKYEIIKHPINSAKPLPSLEKIEYSDIVLPSNINLNNLKENNDIFAKFYAKKEKNAPWVLLKIDFLNF